MKKVKNNKTSATPSRNDSPCSKPPPEEVALCAYLIWEHENFPHGRDVAHWLQAEALLQNRKQKTGSL